MLILALGIVTRIVLSFLTSTTALGQQVSQSTGLGGHDTVLSFDDGRGSLSRGRCLCDSRRPSNGGGIGPPVVSLDDGLVGGGRATGGGALPFVLPLGRQSGRRSVGTNTTTSGAVRQRGGRFLKRTEGEGITEGVSGVGRGRAERA